MKYPGRAPGQARTRALPSATAWLFMTGCGYDGTFADQPIVWRVDDQKHIAEPEATDFHYIASALDWYLSPLDHFSIDHEQLCAVDLSVYHGIVSSGLVEALDDRDEVRYDTLVGPRGRVCLPIHDDDDYRIYRLRTRRRARTATLLRRTISVRRDE